MGGGLVMGVSSALCMRASRLLTIPCGRPIIAVEYCCLALPQLLGMVNMALGCRLLEEEGRGGRREEAHARSKSGAVVMIGPCKNNLKRLTMCTGEHSRQKRLLSTTDQDVSDRTLLS